MYIYSCIRLVEGLQYNQYIMYHISHLGGGFKYFYFHPDLWGNDPI